MGCKKAPPHKEKGHSLRLAIHTEPPTLDARRATDTSSVAVIRMCFEGLMRRVQGEGPQLALAEKVKISDGGRVYTFYLRSAYWWDGAPIKASDFEKTWKTILSPNFNSPFASELFILKNGAKAKEGLCSTEEVGVQALTDWKLRVELEHPVPYFLDLIASHSFLPVPQHIAGAHPDWAENPKHFVGNGPFKLVKWHRHQDLVLKKNNAYWDKDAVSIQEIRLSIIHDETTALNMFEVGEVDWAGNPLSNLPPDAAQALAQQDRLHTYPISGTYYYIFNVQQEPFNNLNLRKAFTLAINRREITENIIQSKQQPATSLVPPTIWDISEPFFDDNAVEEARRLFELGLQEQGYTRDTLPTITLTYNNAPTHHKIAQAIQDQWYRALGVRVELNNVKWETFYDDLNNKNFHVARMGGVASFNDPLTFLDLYRNEKGGSNFSGWSNPRFNELLEEANQTTNMVKREALLRSAEKIFIDEMPIAPIYYYTGTYVKQPYVKSVQLSELNEANFKFAYLDNR